MTAALYSRHRVNPMPEYKVIVETTGGDGAAAGEAYTPVIEGPVLTISFTPNAGIPNTTDVTFSEAGGGNRTILTLSDLANADPVTKNPREPVHDTNGDALTLEGTEPMVAPIALGGRRIKVVVEDCNAFTDALTAYIVVGG